MSQITTHVLDVSVGRPAPDIAVTLEIQVGGSWDELGNGKTDADGRLEGLLGERKLEVAEYRLTFATGQYFALRRVEVFYQNIIIVFEVHNPQQHYHVPLLLSPFAYSTYRGS
jgi:5-hydroxyisourate hydrolase